MRWRRRVPDSRRQVLHGDGLAPPSALMYRARRSEAARQVGRQTPGEAVAERSRQRTAHSWLQRFGLIILLAAIVASVVNILTLSTDAKVIPLTEAGNHALLRPAAAYQQAADRQLGSSIWNRNKITVDTNKVSRQLLNQFPELAGVSVTVPLLAHRPLVYIEAAQPALILVSGSGTSYVIDTAGKALLAAASPAALRQPGLPLVNDQTGLSVRLNRQALSVNNVDFINTVVVELAAKQFTVSSMTLPAATSELDVHLNGQPYFVKFNLQSANPRGEAGAFLATIAQLQRQHVTPSQYVDVRVDGRAYYK